MGLFFKQASLQFSQQINVKNVMAVQYSNSRPPERESSPITTRPGLPPEPVFSEFKSIWDKLKGNLDLSQSCVTEFGFTINEKVYFSVSIYCNHTHLKIDCLGRGGGQVVSVLAFYSDDPSSNPAEVYNFSVKLLLKRTKIYKKRPGLAHLKK